MDELNEYEKSIQSNNPQSEKKGGIKKFLIIIPCFVIAIILLCFLYYMGTTATIPDIKNKNINEAEKLLNEAGITYSVKSVYNNTIKKGTIIDITPSAGRIDKKEQMNIVVSAGFEVYSGTNIPDFGKYIGIDLEYEGYTDQLGKVYRYNISEVLEADPKAKKLAEYTTLLVEQYGYTYMGHINIEDGYFILLKDANNAVSLIMTTKYFAVSIKH